MRSEASGSLSPHEQGNTRVHVNVLVCNICLVPPTDPVLTVCGHLFCWPCLYKWLHQAQSKTCPFCRIGLREDVSITPVYGSPETETSSAEPGAIPGTIPKRPAPPFGSSLENLENLDDSGPNSSRFVSEVWHSKRLTLGRRNARDYRLCLITTKAVYMLWRGS